MQNLKIPNSINSAIPAMPRDLAIKYISDMRSNVIQKGADLASDTFEKSYMASINEEFKKLGVKVKSKTKNKINTQLLEPILEGLLTSKNADLELPKIVRFKKGLKSQDIKLGGAFSPWFPWRILINPDVPSNSIPRITIHETIHKNDKKRNSSKLIDIFTNNQSMLSQYFWLEFDRYAISSRDEFIAHIATEVLSQKNGWANLSDETCLKNLYRKLEGPKLKLPE